MKTTNTAWFFTALAFSMTLACNKSDAAGKQGAGGTSVIADDHGYTPSSIDVPVDKPTAVTFTRTTDDTCAKEVVFPELKINEPLPLNKPVTITIPAGPARTLTFQCGMGMFKGKVVAH